MIFAGGESAKHKAEMLLRLKSGPATDDLLGVTWDGKGTDCPQASDPSPGQTKKRPKPRFGAKARFAPSPGPGATKSQQNRKNPAY
jgi:hypothetical protein